MRPRASRPRAPPAKTPVRAKAPANRPPPKAEPTLQEQLQSRLGNLKKVDHSQIQQEKQQSRLTGQQEMKLTAQMATLAQQLSARKNALGNNPQKRRGSGSSSDSDNDKSSSDDNWSDSD